MNKRAFIMRTVRVTSCSLILTVAGIVGLMSQSHHAYAAAPTDPIGSPVITLTYPVTPTIDVAADLGIIVDGSTFTETVTMTLVLNVPYYFDIDCIDTPPVTVTSGITSTYTPTSTDIIWSLPITPTVVQTIVVSVKPLTTTVGSMFDAMLVYLHKDNDDAHRYDNLQSTLYVKVGTLSQPGIVTATWPNAIPLLNGSYWFESASEVELTEDFPLSVGMALSSIINPSATVTAILTIHNTSDETATLDGNVRFPDNWVLSSVQAAITDTLDPDDTIERTFDVIPSDIPCRWAIKFTTNITEPIQVGDMLVSRAIFEKRGGLYPCMESDGWQAGEPADGQAPYIVQLGSSLHFSDEICPSPQLEDNPTCQPGQTPRWFPICHCTPNSECPVDAPAIFRVVVSGQIFALSKFPQSALARLRLQIFAASLPPDNTLGVGGSQQTNNQPLAEVHLTQGADVADMGRFSVCIPWHPAIVLRVAATDRLTCETEFSAQTVLGGFNPLNSDVYVASSPPIPIPFPYTCSAHTIPTQYVDEWIHDETAAAAFYPATMIANDMRIYYYAPELEVDIIDPSFRATFSYPDSCPDSELDKPTNCYRSDDETIFLVRMGEATSGDTVDHEYGHRAHDGIHGFNDSDSVYHPLVEPVAELLRLDKRYITATRPNREYTRLPTSGSFNHTLGFYETTDNREWPQSAYDGLVPAEVYVPWFMDIYDSVSDTVSPISGCTSMSNVSDSLSVSPFKELWDGFADNEYPQDPPTLGHLDWLSHWLNVHAYDPSELVTLRDLSRNHNMLGCTDVLP